MRSLSIFGATGSVGESAFDLLMRAGGPDAYRTIALTGGRVGPGDALALGLATDFAPAAAFDALLDRLAEGGPVEAALVWTDGPKLMPIPETLLAAALASS